MAEYEPCLTCYHLAVCYKIEHYGRDIHSKIPCELYMSIVDTETVVRCKDCIFNENGICTHSEYYDDENYKPDWFCADGIRKEAAND